MNCVEELVSIGHTTLILLCIQIIFVLWSFFQKNIRLQDRFLPIVLIIAHPRLWKENVDCGEELLHTSVLFFVAGVGLSLWTLYRIRLEEVQGEEHQD